MQTTQVLELRFKNEAGKLTKLNVKNPMPSISSDLAQESLETIARLNLFSNKEGLHYKEPVDARYITRQVDEIYPVEI